MDSPSIEATMVLSDAAQANNGKLYIIGGGWTRAPANMPVPMALGIIVHVPFDMTNRQIKLEAVLRDDDAEPVQVEGNTVAAAAEFEVGRPAGIKQGEQLNFPLALNFQPIPLPPGGYVWECSVQGDVKARCLFRIA